MSSAAPKGRFSSKVKTAEPAGTKKLNIKINVLNRTCTDLEYAKKEVQRETERLESFKKDDPDKVSQQLKVIDEAKMMVPHSENRIRAAIKDLSDYIKKEDDRIEDDALRALAAESISKAEALIP